MNNAASPQRITIVAHGLRAGGGISVGQNAIEQLVTRYPGASFQIIVPDLASYREMMTRTERPQWVIYRDWLGLIGRWLYDRFTLIRLVDEFSPDVILCLGNIAVGSTKYPQILLIHDPHYFYPALHYARETRFKKLVAWLKKRRFRKDLQNVSLLLCQTESAADRVRTVFHFSKDIVIFPNALSVHSIKGAAATDRPTKIRDDNAFKLFYLTRYYPHKNIEALIELFIKYRHELANVQLYLTIAADQHTGAKPLLQAIQSHGLQNNIINIGPISQLDIAAYFKAVDAMIMPTTLESFSGSYLEAMAFDCPILTSDLDFAREVCKDAALYFDPWSVDSIYMQLRRVIDDADLRQSLVAHGRRVFENSTVSWEENARTLAAAIDQVATLGRDTDKH